MDVLCRFHCIGKSFRTLVVSCGAIQAKVIAAKADHELTFKPDQSNGAGQFTAHPTHWSIIYATTYTSALLPTADLM